MDVFVEKGNIQQKINEKPAKNEFFSSSSNHNNLYRK